MYISNDQIVKIKKREKTRAQVDVFGNEHSVAVIIVIMFKGDNHGMRHLQNTLSTWYTTNDYTQKNNQGILTIPAVV